MSLFPNPDDYPEFDPIVLKCLGYLHVGGKESRRGLKDLLNEQLTELENDHSKSRGSSPSVKVKQSESILNKDSPIKGSPLKIDRNFGEIIRNSPQKELANEKRKGGLLEKDPSKKARIDPVKEDILPRFHQNPQEGLGLVSEPCNVCRNAQTSSKDQIMECNECHKSFHQRCHNPKIPDSVVQERINDTRSVWKCEPCNQEFARAMKESKKRTELQIKEDKASSQPFKRADKVANIISVSRSREGSPSLAGWVSLGSREKPKKEKKLQQIDIFGGTDDLNIKKKKEVNPNAVKALKEKEKKKKDENKKSSSRSREKEEADAQKKLANMKKKGADKMKLKQAAKRV